MNNPRNVVGTKSAIYGALAVFIVWSLATYLLEGAQHTLLRPEARMLRAIYMLVANYVVGIGLAVVAIRWTRVPPPRAGFGSLRHALIAVAAGSLAGALGYWTLGGATTHPVALANLYAQVLGVSMAEIVVCWSLVGVCTERLVGGSRKAASLGLGIGLSSVLFGGYHFAHSPPFNTLQWAATLSVVGVATGIFFFSSRDVYGTIAFHNWLGVIGVSQSLDAAGKLEEYQQPIISLYATGLLGLGLLVVMHRKLAAPLRESGQLDPSLRRQRVKLGRTLVELLVGGAQVALCVIGAPILRRWYNQWGATDHETAEALPGDELVPAPKLGYTRAITIDAPPEEVWPWLVQIGQRRGGFYSYDALENVVGCRIHSVDRVLPEHQHLDRHDLIRSGPGNRASWEVMDVDPRHHLVLMGADPDTHRAPPVLEEIPDRGHVASTWQWVLRPQPAGRTRLIVRQRLTFSPHQRVLWHIVEPINFVMEKEMLRGIARRAERTIRS